MGHWGGDARRPRRAERPEIVAAQHDGGKCDECGISPAMSGRTPVNPKRRGIVPPGMSLTREDLENGRMRQLLAASGHGPRPLTDEELDASIRCVLAGVRTGEDVWIFAYGSLLWNPLLEHDERRPATLRGFHRRFCLWSRMGRGTPDQPGLVLGLDLGGSCHGLAYRLPAAQARGRAAPALAPRDGERLLHAALGADRGCAVHGEPRRQGGAPRTRIRGEPRASELRRPAAGDVVDPRARRRVRAHRHLGRVPPQHDRRARRARPARHLPRAPPRPARDGRRAKVGGPPPSRPGAPGGLSGSSPPPDQAFDHLTIEGELQCSRARLRSSPVRRAVSASASPRRSRDAAQTSS